MIGQSWGYRWWDMADSWDLAVPRTLCAVRRACDQLWFFGEIDESNADELAVRTVAEIRFGAVGLDLSRVRFFAVAGTRILLAARAASISLEDGLTVVCSAEVMRTLQLCRLVGTDGLRFTEAPRPCVAARNGRSSRRGG
jgi:anti-anti-sigma regulatory factor